MPDPINLPYDSPLFWTIMGYYALALVGGYLLGSIPFGLVFTKLAGMDDIRKIGSGNIGATNVLRTGNKKIAAATLLGDVLKGTAAVLLGKAFGPDTAVLAGLGAFVGHCFPIWLKFKGGKGVATYIGVLIGFSWIATLAFAAIWLACAFISRMSSLSALLATLATPFILYFMGHVQWAELFIVLTSICWYRHRENLGRILSGKETRIGKKS